MAQYLGPGGVQYSVRENDQFHIAIPGLEVESATVEVGNSRVRGQELRPRLRLNPCISSIRIPYLTCKVWDPNIRH